MKSNSSVRRPALTHSGINTSADESVSIGTVLRRAKKNLFFKRCLIGIFIVLLITLVVCLFLLGYVDLLMDKFYSLLG